MRWVVFCWIGLLGGCATSREFTINTLPPDAAIQIDGVNRGRSPVKQELVFDRQNRVHRIAAQRPGYKDVTVQLTRDYPRNDVLIQLKPLTRRLNFTILPVPAVVSIDGKPLSPDPVGQISTDLEFTVEAGNTWTSYLVTAQRPGYEPAEQTVTWTDPNPSYTLMLEPMRKDLNITTTPEGAQVYLDDEQIGVSPFTDPSRAFPVDPQTEEWIPHQIKAVLPGYEPVEMTIGWDEGQTDYHIDLIPKTKTVQILTRPTGATVTIEGAEVTQKADGIWTAELAFPPVNEKGELRTHAAVIQKKTADSEWEPVQLTIGWDEGKQEYVATLKEIKTRPVPLLSVDPKRSDQGWELLPKRITTLAMKDMTEGKKAPPMQLTQLPKGTIIDTLAVSPDGLNILYTTLKGTDKSNFRSDLRMIRSDGTGGEELLSDGRTLDITPSFTPDGKQIIFSSNRGGRRHNVWSMAVSGTGATTQLTIGDTNDIWPMVDADPEPRLFYQAFVDTRPDPRLYMTQLGTTKRTDLTYAGGLQPRISPKGDSVIFTSINEITGKRDIYKMPDKGGVAENLTNTPNIDEFDPAWSADGRRIAFVSDEAINDEKLNQFDIWILEPGRPGRQQVTTNGSWDDGPAWDPAGNAIYFRSNRGGEWAIWRVEIE